MDTIYKLSDRLNNPSLASLLIRIALGLVFLNAGWMKIANMDTTIFFFGKIGIPAVLAYYVAYVELLGGLFLIFGILARYAGLLLAINVLVATKIHFANGFSLANNGYEYTLTLALCSLAIIFLGAGKYSIDHVLKNK